MIDDGWIDVVVVDGRGGGGIVIVDGDVGPRRFRFWDWSRARL